MLETPPFHILVSQSIATLGSPTIDHLTPQKPSQNVGRTWLEGPADQLRHPLVAILARFYNLHYGWDSSFGSEDKIIYSTCVILDIYVNCKHLLYEEPLLSSIITPK